MARRHARRHQGGVDDRGQDRGDRDADQAADQADGDRLEQELAEDAVALGADRLADADLARALGDRDEHDVHHADAADEERDAGDQEADQQHHAHDVVERPDQRVQLVDGEVVRLGRPQLADLAHLADRPRTRGRASASCERRLDRDVDVWRRVAAEDLARRCVIGTKTCRSKFGPAEEARRPASP